MQFHSSPSRKLASKEPAPFTRILLKGKGKGEMMADVLEVHGPATEMRFLMLLSFFCVADIGQDTRWYKITSFKICIKSLEKLLEIFEIPPKTSKNREVAGETVDTTVDDATGTMETGDVARRGNAKCKWMERWPCEVIDIKNIYIYIYVR